MFSLRLKIIMLGIFVFSSAQTFSEYATSDAAKACKSKKENDIDLTSHFKGHSNQGPIGWCYAHAEADALTYELQSRKLIGKDDEVSAEGISLEYNSPGRLERIANLQVNAPLINQFSGELQKVDMQANEIQGKIDKLKEGSSVNKEEFKKLHEKLHFLESKESRYRDMIHGLTSFDDDGEQEGGFSFSSLEKKGAVKLCLKEDLTSYQDFMLQKSNEASNIPQGHGGFSGGYGGGYNSNNVVNPYSAPGGGAYMQQIEQLFNPNRSSLSKEFLCEQSKGLIKLFKNLKHDEVYEVLFDDTILDPLKKLHDKNCNRNYKGEFEIKKAEGLDSLKAVDEALNLNKPAVIYYDASIVTDPSYYLDEGLSVSDGDEQINHASTIVGKKYNCKTGQNEYILKNSWGEDACEKGRASMVMRLGNSDDKIDNSIYDCQRKCQDTKTGYEVNICTDLCEIDGNSEVESKYSKNIYSCENGYYVVPEETLGRAVGNAMYINNN